MPRIPAAELERLKREVSLLRLIQSQGHELKKQGKDWAMRCVFHEEGTASLMVSEEKNLYHCFGCGAAGSVVDWVMKTQSVSLPHAVQILKEGAALAGSKVGVVRSNQRHLPTLEADEAQGQLLLGRVVDYYHATLKQTPAALGYLQSRGLTHPELIEHFRLGHANRTLTYRLAPSHTIGGKEVRRQLRQVGILRASGQEHLDGCLTVPVVGLEEEGSPITQLYGRRTHAQGSRDPRHLYLSRPLTGVWNEAALIADKETILCEALIDAMTFWSAGWRNVITSFGANGFTPSHWDALKRHGTRRVLIAYDRDEAGEAAADKLATELLEAGIECFRVQFPKGMDANDYARKVTPPDKSLGLALQRAQWLGKGKRPGVTAAQPPAEIPSLAAIAPAPAPEPEPAPLPAPAPELPSLAAREPQPEPEAEVHAQGELRLTLGDRHWRIRGWQKNLAPELMRINAQVRREATQGAEAAYHVDTLDLYSAKQRAAYAKQAAIELGIEEASVKRDIGKVLLKLEALQDKAITDALAPKQAAPPLTEADERAAMEFLKSPGLLGRIVSDLSRCGIVGEATNLQVGYLAAVSRKLDSPLAVLIQSSSAAGKSSLMDAVLELMPPEERIQYSAMTGQSLFYLGETDLQHKILAIAEEQGVRQAAYALKLLQSDGELTIASTGKDEATGDLVTKQYRVKGPVMLMLTTTAIDIDEELLNRCLVLTVNETREQTQAIHQRQRAKQTLEGLLMEADRQAIIAVHQNAQRLLKPVHVVNPYAQRLTFLDDKTRTRRDHLKYLTLIRAIALLHQHQRPVKSVEHRGERLEYIEASREDIAAANQLAHDVLGRTLDDMPPQTRRLLHLIHGMVDTQAKAQGVPADEVRFTRRDVREATGWSDNQLKVHCLRLAEMEYLLVHGGSRGHSLHYELAYDGKGEGAKHLCGLIEPGEWEALDSTPRKLGEEAGKIAPSCPQVGAKLEPPNGAQRQAGQGLEASQVGFAPRAINSGGGTPPLAAVA